ncbi:aldo/keto reductase [Actinomyces naeslundii]|jgi:morphine 6-dehydrogenase|uniref:Aldo/keto reductase n=1 Tax=Actinomyces naeslundii TaxID=1655 RepID=A0AA47INT9_ACTNA|nr:aldo/keto reductase [Actinomyces naeslundii]OMG16126.1 2,5-diketo-D-gluconic acid reductase [Actinomyces naeslundii]WAL42858.1 aldo/keto reductase [Actinomyces naeslundii]
MSILEKTYILSNGVKIPKLGLGTWFINNGDASEAVRQAAKIGYRLVDTAQAYGNEAGVGEGIRTCGVPRDQMFVTSKIAAKAKSYDSAAKAVDDILGATGLDYLDLIIIHSPQPWKDWRKDKKRYFPENVEAWRALEGAYKAGKLRAIGVSNFLQDDLQNVLDNCSVRPMVNQVLCHISNTPARLIDFCRKEGVQIEAYAPVAHGRVLKNRKIAGVAQKYGATVAQLCIRYDIQLGLVALPKSGNPAHMAENAAVDFEISEADMQTLKNFEPITGYGMMRIMPVFRGKPVFRGE